MHQGEKQHNSIFSEALWIQASPVWAGLPKHATECLPVVINHGLLPLWFETQAEMILSTKGDPTIVEATFLCLKKKKNLIFSELDQWKGLKHFPFEEGFDWGGGMV